MSIFMGSSGIIRASLESSGLIWDHLGSLGNSLGGLWQISGIWDVGSSGFAWDHLGSSGIIRDHLGSSGKSLGGLLELSLRFLGALWEGSGEALGRLWEDLRSSGVIWAMVAMIAKFVFCLFYMVFEGRRHQGM